MVKVFKMPTIVYKYGCIWQSNRGTPAAKFTCGFCPEILRHHKQLMTHRRLHLENKLPILRRDEDGKTASAGSSSVTSTSTLIQPKPEPEPQLPESKDPLTEAHRSRKADDAMPLQMEAQRASSYTCRYCPKSYPRSAFRQFHEVLCKEQSLASSRSQMSQFQRKATRSMALRLSRLSKKLNIRKLQLERKAILRQRRVTRKCHYCSKTFLKVTGKCHEARCKFSGKTKLQDEIWASSEGVTAKGETQKKLKLNHTSTAFNVN